MLNREKIIRDALAAGKKIYEIDEACCYHSDMPSQTEPGQALSVATRVKLAEAGIGSMGVTDDMFDFDENVTVDEAIERTRMDLQPEGVSSLYDVLERKIALYRAAAERAKKRFAEKTHPQSTQIAHDGSAPAADADGD